MNETTIRTVVEEVLAELGKSRTAPPAGLHTTPVRPMTNGKSANGKGIPVMSATNGHQPSAISHQPTGNDGVFDSVDAAVAAATEAFKQLKTRPIADRTTCVQIVKDLCEKNAELWGRMEFEETKIGRLDHKIQKLKIIKLVPGTEYLKTDAWSGDGGITLEEYAPFGVIGAITPVTHSLPTLAGNVVNMLAAGNAMVVNPHPSGAKIACEGVRALQPGVQGGDRHREPRHDHRQPHDRVGRRDLQTSRRASPRRDRRTGRRPGRPQQRQEGGRRRPRQSAGRRR